MTDGETALAKNKKMKSVPYLPLAIQQWPKEQLHQYLLDSLAHSIGSAVPSEFLARQLEACLAGLRGFENEVADVRRDEMARRYQQLFDEAISHAKTLLEDHVLVFFVACQLYVTRVVEAVRWFKLLEGGHFGLAATYSDSDEVRCFGKPVVEEMTIADCMWYLGNYAKHNDELEEFTQYTQIGLKKLKVCETDGAIAPDAIWRGIQSVTGRSVDSSNDIKLALEFIEKALRAWADELTSCIIADLDNFGYGDPAYTKRLNEQFKVLVSSLSLHKK